MSAVASRWRARAHLRTYELTTIQQANNTLGQAHNPASCQYGKSAPFAGLFRPTIALDLV